MNAPQFSATILAAPAQVKLRERVQDLHSRADAAAPSVRPWNVWEEAISMRQSNHGLGKFEALCEQMQGYSKVYNNCCLERPTLR